MMRLNWANAAHWNDRMLGTAMTIRGLSIPVIAMVNGWCMGGGNELALWCDLVVCSDTAVFGQTGAKVRRRKRLETSDTPRSDRPDSTSW